MLNNAYGDNGRKHVNRRLTLSYAVAAAALTAGSAPHRTGFRGTETPAVCRIGDSPTRGCLFRIRHVEFVPFNRGQWFLLPPYLKEWLAADDLAHLVVAAVDQVPLGQFAVPDRTGGKPQYHPRLTLER
jgi:hypothetical protein